MERETIFSASRARNRRSLRVLPTHRERGKHQALRSTLTTILTVNAFKKLLGSSEQKVASDSQSSSSPTTVAITIIKRAVGIKHNKTK